MRLIIPILFLASGICSAQTNDLSRFVEPNGVAYAFVEAPAAMLQTVVPEGTRYGTVTVSNAVTDADGNVITPAVTRQKTMDEFVILQRTSLDGSKVVVLLSASQGRAGRYTPMTPALLAEWEPFMDSCGLPISSWLTKNEYLELIKSEAYNQEEL